MSKTINQLSIAQTEVDKGLDVIYKVLSPHSSYPRALLTFPSQHQIDLENLLTNLEQQVSTTLSEEDDADVQRENW